MKWMLIAYLHLLSAPHAVVEVKVKRHFDSQQACYAFTEKATGIIDKLLTQEHSDIKVNCIVIHKEGLKHEEHSTI